MTTIPKLGDTVYLNSGSPALTVVEDLDPEAKATDINTSVSVTWFANRDEVQYSDFPVACLTATKPEWDR